MQLDRTEIVVRARSGLELFDLSLRVLKRHLGAIALTSALFGLPLLLLDLWTVNWRLGEQGLNTAARYDQPTSTLGWRHALHMILLFSMQFPLISLPTTIFLGSRIFYQPLPLKELLRRLWTLAPRWLLVLGVFRWGLVVVALEWMIDRNADLDWLTEFFLIFVVSCVILFARALYPFAPEILGLELCPLRAQQAGQITYGSRRRGLHRYLTSENFARFIATLFYGVLLVSMLVGIQLFAIGASTGVWTWNYWMSTIGLPLSLWCVGLLLAVVRFLSYLDCRIRLEGWELELRIKAEAARLEQHAAISTEAKPPGLQPAPTVASGASTATSSSVSAATRLGIMFLAAGLLSGAMAFSPLASGARAEHTLAQSTTELTEAQRAAQSLPIKNWYDANSGSYVPPQVPAAQDNALRSQGLVGKAPAPQAASNSSWWPDWNWGGGAGMGNWWAAWGQWLSISLYILSILVLISLIALLVYYSVRDYWPERSDKKLPAKALTIDPARMVDLPFEMQDSSGDPLSAARAALQRRDFDAAIAYLFSYLLLALDQSRTIHLQRGKTNRMYLAEIKRNVQLASIVEQAMLLFEASYFGKHTATERPFLEVWEQLDTFHRQLQIAAPSAAAQQASNTSRRTVDLSTGLGLLGLLALTSGCNQWLPELVPYGAVESPDVHRSLNGLGLHRKLWEAEGVHCLTPSKLSPKLESVDVIVLVGQTFEPPGQAARDWLEQWLADGSARSVIYFGRDFNAEAYYRQQTLELLPPADRPRGQELLALRQVAELSQRLQQLPESTFCEWFTLDTQAEPQRLDEFSGEWTEYWEFEHSHGTWPTGVMLRPPDQPRWRQQEPSWLSQGPVFNPFRSAGALNGNDATSTHRSRWSPEELRNLEEWQAAIDRAPESEILLESHDGQALVFRLLSERFGDGQILIVNNGFPMLNGSLVEPLAGAIGQAIIQECLPAWRVALLAYDEAGLLIDDAPEKDSRGAGLEMLTVWPLSAITMAAAFLGIVVCAALWPVLGRPQETPAQSTSDFGLHIDAIGRLMWETRDEAFAKQSIEEYYRRVRQEAPPAWLDSNSQAEPAKQPEQLE